MMGICNVLGLCLSPFHDSFSSSSLIASKRKCVDLHLIINFSSVFSSLNQNISGNCTASCTADWGKLRSLDFAYALANHRLKLKLGKSVSQSAARIQMVSHHMSKSCENLPCSSNFHDTHIAPGVFHHRCKTDTIQYQFGHCNLCNYQLSDFLLIKTYVDFYVRYNQRMSLSEVV